MNLCSIKIHHRAARRSRAVMGNCPALRPARVVRRGFADNVFQVIARPPCKGGRVLGRGRYRRRLNVSSWRGMWRYAVLHPPHRREAATGPLAVRWLEPENATHSQSSGEAVSPASAVGLTALCVMGSRKAGRAKYTPLWWCGGGGGRTPPSREKNANMDVCVFFYHSAPGHGPGAAPPPLSR